MPPPVDRRRFLKSVGLGIAAVAIGGCADGERGGADESTLDYPLGLPLPFAHGVASGDPLADRVILWTRVTEVTRACHRQATAAQCTTAGGSCPVTFWSPPIGRLGSPRPETHWCDNSYHDW